MGATKHRGCKAYKVLEDDPVRLAVVPCGAEGGSLGSIANDKRSE